MSVKITDEQLRQCLYAGMLHRKIAEKYNMSPGSVANRIKKLWSSKETKAVSVDDVWKDLIHGMSIHETAAKHKVTIPTIYNYIRTKGGMEELQRQRAAHEELQPAEKSFKTYGQKKAEEIKDQTRINPNNALQEMLEREKKKTRELLQKVKELEKENARLRSC